MEHDSKNAIKHFYLHILCCIITFTGLIEMDKNFPFSCYGFCYKQGEVIYVGCYSDVHGESGLVG